mmetsp:Transcript_11478/g.25495  ORF Transcript_11478/g.25495 Transcript_11478/m.25495 type:complete len:203 (+) Transcript_11478:1654-2262(+)
MGGPHAEPNKPRKLKQLCYGVHQHKCHSSPTTSSNLEIVQDDIQMKCPNPPLFVLHRLILTMLIRIGPFHNFLHLLNGLFGVFAFPVGLLLPVQAREARADLGVAALCYHLALFQHHHAVTPLRHLQPVRSHHPGLASQNPHDRAVVHPLGHVGIQGAVGVVEHEDVTVLRPVGCASQADSSLLPAAHGDALLPHEGAVPAV